MSRKASKTSRAQNKAARAERYDEIMARWKRRAALRQFDLFLEGWTPAAAESLANVLHFGRWAQHDDLIDRLDPTLWRALLLHALRVIELKEMNYDDYLQTEEWRAKAAQCKTQYGQRCALDSSHSADHAHHRTYERRGREHHDDLIPLCADCHAKFHGKR